MSSAPVTLEPVSMAAVERPLPLILRLAGLLEDSSVTYCHWKSNAAIDRSARGDNDLDLLVDRRDVAQFTELLSRLGLARVHKRSASIAGIESFYGFDAETDRLVHVHAHYQLVLGDDRTKNYRLPIEDAYLRSATRAGTFRLPSPEFEYVVFVIRMTLKYCTWDEIAWGAIRGRRAAPKRTERDEFEYLRARADEQRTASILEEHLPYLEAMLFADCVDVLASPVSVRRRMRTGRKLEKSLQVHARRSRRVDSSLRIWRRIARVATRRFGSLPRNRFAGGGVMVGIMGGDGSGKSTALTALDHWLGPEFDVCRVHLGKPPWSGTTVSVRAGLKGVNLCARAVERVHSAPTRRFVELVATYRPLIWLVCTARDRQLAYRRARRFAMDGGLVLCDRYPDPRLTSMEVPLIPSRTEGEPQSRFLRMMIRLEERYHSSIAPPELLVVLKVDPEVAVQRKTSESPDSVRTRGAEIWNIDWRDSRTHVIDAGQSEEAVARELKALVWSALV